VSDVNPLPCDFPDDNPGCIFTAAGMSDVRDTAPDFRTPGYVSLRCTFGRYAVVNQNFHGAAGFDRFGDAAACGG
jgi:hypothetical protein